MVEAANDHYERAVSYPLEHESQSFRCYNYLQTVLRTNKEEVVLSVFRIQLGQQFIVVLLGEEPPEEFNKILDVAFSGSQPYVLPRVISQTLWRRRGEVLEEGLPYFEGHYRR